MMKKFKDLTIPDDFCDLTVKHDVVWCLFSLFLLVMFFNGKKIESFNNKDKVV